MAKIRERRLGPKDDIYGWARTIRHAGEGQSVKMQDSADPFGKWEWCHPLTISYNNYR